MLVVRHGKREMFYLKTFKNTEYFHLLSATVSLKSIHQLLQFPLYFEETESFLTTKRFYAELGRILHSVEDHVVISSPSYTGIW